MSDQNSSLTIRIGVAGGAAAISEINKVAGSIVGAFAGITAQFNPAAIFDSIKGVLQFGSDLQKLHDQTGAAVSGLVALDRALSRIGQNAENAATLIAKMQKAVSLAATGQDATAMRDFSILGLDPKQLSQLDADKQLYSLGQALTNVANADQRAQIAMDLFGRSGAQMLAIFKNGRAMETLAKGTGDYGEALQRSAADWQDAVFNLHETSEGPKRFWTGFLDQIPVKDITDKLYSAFDSLDLVKVGGRFGALAVIITDFFKEDKFPEMLGLLIEAGFELGEIAVKATWNGLWTALTSATAGQIYMALGNAILSFGVGAAKFLINVLTEPVIYMAATFDWLGSHIKDVFEDAINFFITRWNAGIDEIPGFGKLKLHLIDKRGADTFSESLDDMRKFTEPLSKGAVNYLTDSLNKTREILGLNSKLGESDNTQSTALQRLNALIQEQIDKWTAAQKAKAAAANADTQGNTQVVEAFDARKFIAQQEVALNEDLLKIKRQLAEVESDYSKTNAEKYAEKAALYQKEVLEYQTAIDQNNTLLKSGTVPADQQIAIAKRNEQLAGGLTGAQDSLSKMGADPNSFSQQFTAKLTDIRNKAGTVAQEVAGTFESVFDNLSQSITKGISGWIEGTESWGQAMRQIGSSVFGELIQSIIKMGVQFLLTHVLMRGAMFITHALGINLGWQQVTATNSQEASKAPALAANAATASVGSYGSAAIVGAIAAVAAIGLITAAALGAFAEGGYTGAGGKYDVAGLVHRGEIVWSQGDIARAGGVSAVESMRSGGGAAAGGNQTNLALHVWGADDETKMHRTIQQNPDVRHAILDLVTKEVRWA